MSEWGSGDRLAHEQEWRRKRIEAEQQGYSSLVDNVRAFIEQGAPINFDTLKQGVEAHRFLKYTDEDGPFDFGTSEYHAKQRLGLYGGRVSENMKAAVPDLALTLQEASGRARFLRGPHGDMSDLVPLALRREMQAEEITQLEAVADLYKRKVLGDRQKTYVHLGPDIAALRQAGAERFAGVQKKINPYISADMAIALEHQDAYKQLRQALLDAGDNRDVYLIGESAALFARNLMADIFDDEFQKQLTYFTEHPDDSVDLQERNALVRWEGALDREWQKQHPYQG